MKFLLYLFVLLFFTNCCKCTRDNPPCPSNLSDNDLKPLKFNSNSTVTFIGNNLYNLIAKFENINILNNQYIYDSGGPSSGGCPTSCLSNASVRVLFYKYFRDSTIIIDNSNLATYQFGISVTKYDNGNLGAFYEISSLGGYTQKPNLNKSGLFFSSYNTPQMDSIIIQNKKYTDIFYYKTNDDSLLVRELYYSNQFGILKFILNDSTHTEYELY